MKNPNGPSIEEIDDWNDALRDQIVAEETRKILFDAVDNWEANTSPKTEHDNDWYQENDPQSLVDSIREHNS